MPFRILVALLLLPTAVPADERRTEYYRRAVPAAQQFVQRLEQAEPAGDFTVYTLFDNIALLVAANADLPKEQRPSLEQRGQSMVHSKK